MDPCNENDQNTFQEIANLNLNKISRNIQNIGYTDGITDGRESVFQNGFDQGYSDSLRLSFELQKYRKAAEIILNSLKIEKSEDFKKELEVLCSKNPRDKEHFKMLENLSSPIFEVTKIQNDHTNEVLKYLKDNFPLFHEVVNN